LPIDSIRSPNLFLSRNEHDASDMSVSPESAHASNVAARFSHALMQRIGGERFQMWFGDKVQFVLVPRGQIVSTPSTATHHETALNSDALNDAALIEPTTRSEVNVMRVIAAGQFALERLKKNFMSEMRGAAASIDPNMRIELCAAVAPIQSSLPLGINDDVDDYDNADGVGAGGTNAAYRRNSSTAASSTRTASSTSSSRQPSATQSQGTTSRTTGSRGGRVSSIQNLADQAILGKTRQPPVSQRNHPAVTSAATRSNSTATRSNPAARSTSPFPTHTANANLSNDRNIDHASAARRGANEMTMETFLTGSCNTLAHTAAMMVCNDPQSGSLVYLSGPSGCGKTHLLTATADYLRRKYRLRGVIQMSAEHFTNEFVAVVGKTGITDFRTRYRDVDALMIDDVHFFAKKKATIRELIHTIGEVQRAGKLIVFAGNASPHDVDGFTSELAGRLSSGLVCSMTTLDSDTRKRLLIRWISTRCTLAINEDTIDQINAAMIGDGRAISGIVNVINLMQRMNHRTPTFAEIRQNCGHLLRGAGGEITLSTIEIAVSDAFGLEDGALRSGSQTRRVAQPRMLAMYLSRQKTSSAYTEIAKHFNVKSHSTAMAAEKNVSQWLDKESMIGRGAAAVPTAEAIQRIERMLQTG
jgi:chromosomal replication initiator protein